MPRSPHQPKIEALLLLMAFFWGANITVIKVVLREMPPHAFNAIRMVIATAGFCVALALERTDAPPRLTRADVLAIVGLGLIGQFIYQILFLDGVARTSASNSVLIIASSPVVIALLSAVLGHERIRPLHWIGLVFSVTGIYLIVRGRGTSTTGASMTGDLLMVGAVLSWGIYSVASRPVLARHSPIFVTGAAMAVGTLLYIGYAWPELEALRWRDVPASAWAWLTASAVLALTVSYTIWYTAVQRIGNARTSMYSNLAPLFGVALAVVWLGERLTMLTFAGAALTLCGVFLTRLARREELAPEA